MRAAPVRAVWPPAAMMVRENSGRKNLLPRYGDLRRAGVGQGAVDAGLHHVQVGHAQPVEVLGGLGEGRGGI